MSSLKDASRYSNWRPERTQIVDGRAVTYSDVCVHEFTLGDVEDPVLYAAEPINRWSETEAGQWIMSNAEDQPYWIQDIDHVNWGFRFRIMARLSEPNHVFWRLKWGIRNK